MPFFEVVKGQDAYVEYSRVIEADDAQTAFELACTRYFRHGDDWIPNGILNEFDHADVFEDRTELLDAETFDEAVKQIHDAYDFVDLRLTPDQRTIVLNALGAWNTRENPLSPMINNLIEEINHA